MYAIHSQEVVIIVCLLYVRLSPNKQCNFQKCYTLSLFQLHRDFKRYVDLPFIIFKTARKRLDVQFINLKLRLKAVF